MKISLKWLKEIIKDIDLTPSLVEETLTSIGLEVEEVKDLGKELENIVVGEVVSKEKHPDADKLSILKVKTDKDEFQIVCGAKNMNAEDKVCLAKVGAVIPNGNFKIKEAKIRGEKSFGMCCSLEELNLSEKSEGIIILDKKTKLGENASKALGVDDVIFEVATPPNRGDVLSHFGIARELSGALNLELKKQEIKEIKDTGNTELKIDIKDKGCKRYIGKIFKGIKIAPSPSFVQEKLKSIGLKPINNIVDITNFIMHETGQPLHAFDLSKVASNNIIVRNAKDNEKIKLLDETELKLNSKDLLIADKNKPLALAGIMGGIDSSITNETKDIVLECAYFDKDRIRNTSNSYKLLSDSSYRFERGVDFYNMENVVKKTTLLIEEFAMPKEIQATLDNKEEKETLKTIKIDYKDINKFLDTDLSIKQITDILLKIDFKIDINKDFLEIKVPSFRTDVEIKEDIYEEVARFYGLNNIKAILPSVSVETSFSDNVDLLKEEIRKTLKYLSYSEVITYSFTTKKNNSYINNNEKEIKLLNPISENMKYMKLSLIPSILDLVSYNYNRRNLDLKFFEIAKTYKLKEDKVNIPKPNESIFNEEENLCGVVTGKIIDQEDWTRNKNRNCDFYRLKGELETLFNYLKVPSYKFKEKVEVNYLHPGISASINVCGKDIGFIGKIHPEFIKNFDLKEEENIYIFNIKLDMLKNSFNSKTKFNSLPKFPGVRRDLSFFIDEKVKNEDIVALIKKKKINNLSTFGVFDLYLGKGETGRKSMAYYFNFMDNEKTLTENEVDKAMNDITESLKKEFFIEIR
jgi:phenylalanyl-tRNA synthetase beta chain